MKVFIDNQLIKKIVSIADQNQRDLFLQECEKFTPNFTEDSLQFVFGWTSLLTYLGWDSLFESLPKFGDQNRIYDSVVEVLKFDVEKEVIFYLFDQLFVECLNQVKKLHPADPEALLQQIQKRRKDIVFSHEDPFSYALESYEKTLRENPNEARHDFILYLAWDRICVYLAIIFDHSSLKIKNGLRILQECLIESFQHILQQGRTIPSFFRLTEALYAYQMKEENFQTYSESEWLKLCQSSLALTSSDDLIDANFVDFSIMNERNPNKFSLVALTLDSIEKVQSKQILANYFLEKLKREVVDWQYQFRSQEIVCLREESNKLSLEEILREKGT